MDAQRDADLLDAFRKQAPGEATLTGTALAPLARESREAAVSVLSAAPSQVHPDAQIFLRVRVTHATPAAALVPRSTMGASANAGPAWPALAVTAAHRTVLAYRWEDADGRVVASDFASNRVPFDLQPGQTVETTMEIHPPGGFGTFRLVVGVAQDEQWFPGTSAPVAVRVVPRLTKPERWVQESSGNRRLA